LQPAANSSGSERAARYKITFFDLETPNCIEIDPAWKPGFYPYSPDRPRSVFPMRNPTAIWSAAESDQIDPSPAARNESFQIDRLTVPKL
jgi:hypothetical protein